MTAKWSIRVRALHISYEERLVLLVGPGAINKRDGSNKLTTTTERQVLPKSRKLGIFSEYVRVSQLSSMRLKMWTFG